MESFFLSFFLSFLLHTAEQWALVTGSPSVERDFAPLRVLLHVVNERTACNVHQEKKKEKKKPQDDNIAVSEA